MFVVQFFFNVLLSGLSLFDVEQLIVLIAPFPSD